MCEGLLGSVPKAEEGIYIPRCIMSLRRNWDYLTRKIVRVVDLTDVGGILYSLHNAEMPELEDESPKEV